MAVAVDVPESIAAFLDAATPESWLAAARERLPEMLLDHANHTMPTRDLVERAMADTDTDLGRLLDEFIPGQDLDVPFEQ